MTKIILIIGNYIDTHAWAQLVTAAFMLATFVLAVDYDYSLVHDGEEFADAVLDWLGCPK